MENVYRTLFGFGPGKKLIAYAMDGDDIARRSRVILDFLAEFYYVLVKSPSSPFILQAPDLVKQGKALHHLAVML